MTTTLAWTRADAVSPRGIHEYLSSFSLFGLSLVLRMEAWLPRSSRGNLKLEAREGFFRGFLQLVSFLDLTQVTLPFPRISRCVSSAGLVLSPRKHDNKFS